MSLISHGIFRSRISSNLETAHESRCYCHSHSAEVVAFLKKGEVTWLACHRESGAEPDEELAGSSAACRASSPAPGTGAEAGDVIRWPSPPVAFLSLVVGNLCLGRTFLAEWQTGQSSRSRSSPWTGSHNAPSARSPPAPPVVLWDTWPRDRTGRAWVRAEPALCTPGSCPEALCCLFFSVLQHPSLKGCVSNDIKGRVATSRADLQRLARGGQHQLLCRAGPLPSRRSSCLALLWRSPLESLPRVVPQRSPVPRVAPGPAPLPRPAPVGAREMCLSAFAFVCFVIMIGFICLQNLLSSCFLSKPHTHSAFCLSHQT